MNFLAHLFLSGDDEDVKIGNFIGDFVKGNQSNLFPEKIWQGVILHRKIDAFTDSHPIVIKSKTRLRPRYRHYSPVIVDMYYDHFLAANWKDFSHQNLKTYTTAFYDLAWKNEEVLPARVINLLTHMSATDWLYHYQKFEGLNRALTGMSKRTKFDSGMEHAIEDLKDHYDLFEEEFRSFFPELIAFCENLSHN